MGSRCTDDAARRNIGMLGVGGGVRRFGDFDEGGGDESFRRARFRVGDTAGDEKGGY